MPDFKFWFQPSPSGFFALSLSPETYVQVLLDVLESLLQGGFRHIVLLNEHGGNIAPAHHALTIFSHRHDDVLQPNIAFASYRHLAGAAFSGALPLETPAILHADEYETSMMFHLHPERVRRERVRCAQVWERGYRSSGRSAISI